MTVAAAPVDSRRVTWLAGAIMVAGIARRYQVMNALYNPREKLAEGFNVARAFATQGTIADFSRVGDGPTAHLMPLPAMIAGTVYRHFGLLSPTSDLVLTTWSLTLVFVAFALLYAAFRELGSPPAARLLALALVCFLPVNLNLEVIWFRVWDGAMAAFVGALVLYAAVYLDRAVRVSTAAIVGFAVLAAATLFISPPFGLAAYGCAALLMVRRLPVRRWPATAAIAVVALAVVLAPWTIRNAAVMGTPIVLRDNFGLELAQANASELVDSRDVDGGFERHHLEMHPYRSAVGHARMIAAGGEVAYSVQLKAEAEAWIASHPGDFARLTLRHLRQIIFPETWMWPSYPGQDIAAVHRRQAMQWAVSAFGLAGIAYALVCLDRRWRYAAIVTLVPIVPYLIVQPTLRYRYLIFGLLTFLAADVVVRLVRALRPASAVRGRTIRPVA